MVSNIYLLTPQGCCAACGGCGLLMFRDRLLAPFFPFSRLELTARPSKKGPISCFETSVNNYQRMLSKNSEKWEPQDKTYFGQVFKPTFFGRINFFLKKRDSGFTKLSNFCYTLKYCQSRRQNNRLRKII